MLGRKGSRSVSVVFAVTFKSEKTNNSYTNLVFDQQVSHLPPSVRRQVSQPFSGRFAKLFRFKRSFWRNEFTIWNVRVSACNPEAFVRRPFGENARRANNRRFVAVVFCRDARVLYTHQCSVLSLGELGGRVRRDGSRGGSEG